MSIVTSRRHVEIERRCRDVTGARSHQHRMANGRAVEPDAMHEPEGRRRPDPPLHRVDVTSGLAGLLPQEAETIDELGQVIGSGIGERQPSAGPQDARHLGKILGREHAEHEIRRFVLHRPFAPQVDDGKGQRRPPARRALRGRPGDIEAQADHGRGQRRGDGGEVMAGAAARIEHAPAAVARRRTGAPNVGGDRRGERVEVPGLEKCRSMVELLGAVAARHRAARPAIEQVDVALAREVEAVAVAANQGAGGAGEIKTADGAAQQSMAGAGRARRHAAAPSSAGA